MAMGLAMGGRVLGDSPVYMDSIVFNTDTAGIGYIDGLGHFVTVNDDFNGTLVTKSIRASDGAAEYVFHGDLNLSGLRNGSAPFVEFIGSRSASLVVMNNADLSGV
jgi:hypothetical protein